MKSGIDWIWCKNNNFAKPVQPDMEKIKSIIFSAEDREKTARLLPINNITKETVISLFYDVLRELLEALALGEGYKIYNHECYSCFLRELTRDEDFASKFDSLRLLRNNINYYEKRIELGDARQIVEKIEGLLLKAKGMLVKWKKRN